MTTIRRHLPDPKLDLVLERVVDVPRELVWKAWTDPDCLMQWFTPAPWKTVECEIDLRPGGKFHTVMLSPEGQKIPNTGCFLEVIPHEKLVWTACMHPDYRPTTAPAGSFLFSAELTFAAHPRGTAYRAVAIHADPEAAAKHEAMGFSKGWGAALDQLVAAAKGW